MKKLVDAAIRGIHGISTFMIWIGAILVSAIILIIVVHVIGRYFFRHPLIGQVELVQLITLTLVFLIMAYTERRGSHIKVDLVVRLFSRRVQAILAGVTGLLSVVYAAIMCWQGIRLAFVNISPLLTRTDILSIPIFPFMFLLAFGSLILGLEMLISCVRVYVPAENKKQVAE